MKEYICPECGEVMDITDQEERRVAGDGYESEPEYEMLWFELTCSECGYKEIVDPYEKY